MKLRDALLGRRVNNRGPRFRRTGAPFLVQLGLAVCATVFATSPGAAGQLIRVPTEVSTLTTALQQAGDGAVIELTAGTYAAPSGGFKLNNLGKSLTIRAADGAGVTLDGGGFTQVLQILNSSAGAGGPYTFEGITFANGRSTTDGIGGGVTVARAEATFVRCTFKQNSSQAQTTGGGGVFLWGGAKGYFTDCTWSDNTAVNEGAGLRVGSSTAWVHHSIFLRNRVDLPGHRSTAAGGGIHVTDGTLRVSDSRFESNAAGYVGGAIYALGTWSTAGSDVVVANCTFVKNRAKADPSVTPPGPTEGGGLHAEDNTVMRIFASRLDDNSAGNGGGVNLYRASVEVKGCVFRGNRATATGGGTGFGGAISAISNDTTADGSVNRPSASLTVLDSYIQGGYGTTSTVAQIGGGIFANGDSNRHWGLSGVSPTATEAATRAQVVIQGTAFVDCDVLTDPLASGTGAGGAVSVFLADLSVSGSVVIDSDGVGSTSTGGGLRSIASQTSVTGSTFANNTAEKFGGAVFAQAGVINISSSQFLENEIASLTYGSAIFAAPVQGLYATDIDINGTVSNNVFSNTSALGRLVFDDDRDCAPDNDVAYNHNTLYDVSDSYIYAHRGVKQTVPGLNGLVVDRTPCECADKSTVDNHSPSSSPVAGALLAAPSEVLTTAAAGDPSPSGTTYLTAAWSGGAATLDGASRSGHTVAQLAAPGAHTLEVDYTPFSATAVQAPTPAASLALSPSINLASGERITLSWSTPGGTFVAGSVDHAVGAVATASGSLTVTPTATATYRVFVITEQGGAVAEATAWVGEAPPQALFTDNFESHGLDNWSSASR